MPANTALCRRCGKRTLAPNGSEVPLDIIHFKKEAFTAKARKQKPLMETFKGQISLIIAQLHYLLYELCYSAIARM